MPDMALFLFYICIFYWYLHGEHHNEKSKIHRINLKFYR